MGEQFTFGDVSYADVVALDRDLHEGMEVRDDILTSVAGTMRICPIAMSEMERACRSFPITFLSLDDPMPMAQVSLKPGHSPFLLDGRWKPRAYVPQAVRRYPFLLSSPHPDGLQSVLIDSEALKPAQGQSERRLFQNGIESAFLKSAVERAAVYQKALTDTDLFKAVLKEADLLTMKRLLLPRNDREAIELGTAVVIDRERLEAAPAELMTELHRCGMLLPIHAQMISVVGFDLADPVA